MIQPTPPAIAELDRLGDQIAELSAHLDAATARLLDLIRDFDARAGWANGFRSCAHWLAWRVGLDPGAARERVRVARALGTLPRLADALARGELSYSKVRALTRVATPATEERLLALGKAAPADEVERVVRAWRRVDRIAESRETIRQHRRRGLHMYEDEDGMVVLHARLEREPAAVVRKALDAAREALYPSGHIGNVSAETFDAETGHIVCEPPTLGQQQADALALLAETALHGGMNPGAPAERYQVVVHVDGPVLADSGAPGQSAVEDGGRVSAETSRRLACDATRVIMRQGENGDIVEVGARTRTIPPALRRALHHRDPVCRFPGCGLPFGQGHHIKHWANGGPTTLSNLARLCRRHHRAVHEDAYRVERLPSGELQFTRPDGRVFPDVPPAPTVENAIEHLRELNEASGATIVVPTMPDGFAKRLDLGWAIDVLHPRATREM